MPAALAEARQDSWDRSAWPGVFAGMFQRRAGAMIAVLIAAIALLFGMALWLQPESGEGFYAYLSHGMMVALFKTTTRSLVQTSKSSPVTVVPPGIGTG